MGTPGEEQRVGCRWVLYVSGTLSGTLPLGGTRRNGGRRSSHSPPHLPHQEVRPEGDLHCLLYDQPGVM